MSIFLLAFKVHNTCGLWIVCRLN
uniref:Uncharacterized protein n=1 Tax=Rhizophora mucronata TaxID=61149 RepID=A0A2P2PFP8_RHIMU